MRSSFSGVVVLLLAVASACATAGGEVKGGDLTPPGANAVTPGVFINPDGGGANPCLAADEIAGDAGAVDAATVDAGDAGDAGDAATTPTDAGPVVGGDGTKWSDLYRDIFGPGPNGLPRAGSCSFAGTCHGLPDDSRGALLSGPKCFDEKGCRASFLSISNGIYVKPGDPDTSALLVGLLRYCKDPALGPVDGNTVGFMPKEPKSFYFPKKSIDRVKQWIKDGAKDD